MKSFDFSHFEIVLGASSDECSLDDVDELRKQAARLADKAVEQYKVAKRVFEAREMDARAIVYDKAEFLRIEALTDTDRSDAEKAFLKMCKDRELRLLREYDYEDDYGNYFDNED